jgi:hypothetical protein
MGFTLPFDAWFRGPLRAWMEGVLLDGPCGGPAFSAFGGRGALAVFLSGRRPVSHARVWSLAALSVFCEANRITP